MSFTTTKMSVKVNCSLWFCNERIEKIQKRKGYPNLGAVKHDMRVFF